MKGIGKYSRMKERPFKTGKDNYKKILLCLYIEQSRRKPVFLKIGYKIISEFRSSLVLFPSLYKYVHIFMINE
jgi:hypothetical protein